MSIPYSVLDLAPVVEGSDIGSALRQSIRLAEHADQLGYHRFWLAEHHSMPGVASSAPTILIGQVAAATHRIRVGSGGVMLPNHAPLVVAEQFGTLHELFPDRIDLGIGRAPGTDQVTAHALRRGHVSAEDFPQELAALRAFLSGGYPSDHPYSAVTAVPGLGATPQLWLLGSSTYSAQMAGKLGLPFAFARHFAPAQTMPAVRAYRESFRPNDLLDAPHFMITVTVAAADDDATAEYHAAPQRVAMARTRSGQAGRYPTPEIAAANPLTPLQMTGMEQMTSAWIVGGPDIVATRLGQLIEMTEADEVMVSSSLADFDARLRSHELIADILSSLPAVR